MNREPKKYGGAVPTFFRKGFEKVERATANFRQGERGYE